MNVFPRRRQVPSGRVDIERHGNAFEAKTRGVGEFTLLLSPDVIDFAKPVQVIVNGAPVFSGLVKKDLPTLLKWAARDNDRTACMAPSSTSSSPEAGVVIRRANGKDLPALGVLGASLLREHHAFDPQRFMAPRGDPESGYGWFLVHPARGRRRGGVCRRARRHRGRVRLCGNRAAIMEGTA